MSTALTAYLSSVASSTLSSSGALPTVTGAGNTVANSTLIGSATGWGEVTALGTTNAWAASVSQGDPTGNGWLLDPATLDGQTILAGNWTPTLNMAGGNFTADISVRAYIYTAGSYTLIGSMSLSSQNFTTTQKSYAFSATSLVAANFPTGSHLYIDVWLNVSSNSSGVAATIKIKRAVSDTQGNNATQVITPGYQTTASSASLSVTMAGVATLAGTATGVNPPGVNLVQSATGSVGSANATSVTVTTLATGNTNLLLAFVTVVDATPTITPPTGWGQAGSTTNFGSGTGLGALYYKIASAGVTSFVFSFSVACNAAVAFEEWSGIAANSPLDQAVSQGTIKQLQATTGTTPTLGTSGELAVWGVGFGASGVVTYSNVSNGYVQDTNAAAASSEATTKAQAAFFYNMSVGATPTSSSATKSREGSTGSTTVLAVFIPGASGPLVAEFDGVGSLAGTILSAFPLVAEFDGVGAFVPIPTRSTLLAFVGEVDAVGALGAAWFPVPLVAELDASGVLAWAISLAWYNSKSLDGFGDAFGGLSATVPFTSTFAGSGTLGAAPGYVGTLGILFGTIAMQGVVPGVLSASFTYSPAIYATRVLGSDVLITQATTVTIAGAGAVQSAGLSLLVWLYS